MVPTTMKILIVDDHALFRAGLRLILGRLAAPGQLLEAGHAEEGLALGQAHAPLDLILLDLQLPGLAGPDCVRRFRQAFPDCPIALLSGSDEQQLIQDGLAAGARGFIHKSSTPGDMLHVIRDLLERNHRTPARHQAAPLTARQIEVLVRLCAGGSNKQIALDLGLSDNTVRVHLHDIFRSLGVQTRTQAAMLAKDRGLA